jgi:hypothetical protein
MWMPSRSNWDWRNPDDLSLLPWQARAVRAMWRFPCPDWSVRIAGRAEAAGPDSGVDRRTADEVGVVTDDEKPKTQRKWRLRIDLTGSNAGPAFKAVTVRGVMPIGMDPERLRELAAEHYAVPVAQVGKPYVYLRKGDR